MEYSLPAPVVALLQEEKASLAPKAYFISSGKKSIKITLVYAKDTNRSQTSSETGRLAATDCLHRKKARHGIPPKQAKKSSGPRRQGSSSSKASESPPNLRRNDQSSGCSSHSDAELACCSTPEFNMGSSHSQSDLRSHVSTVDSGHPPSSHQSSSGSNRQLDDNASASESEGEGEERAQRECESECSSDSEKPRTPGRDIAVAESSLGPGETPAASRDEMWQTWTRIPRSQAVHVAQKFLAVHSMAADRRSLSPSVSNATRNATVATSQRRPRLHEGVSWDGSGYL